MSPEQASGKPVDQRGDIWALGCVLYEMLTGRRTFPGATTTEILVGVLDREPDWASLPPNTPDTVRRLLRRCLTKDLRSRLHHAGDARLELEDTLAGGSSAGVAVAPKHRVFSRWIGVAAAALVVGSIATAIWAWRGTIPDIKPLLQ